MEKTMDEGVLKTFDDSLRRCNSNPEFLDHFYDAFLSSSPKVREKFKNTDFTRQKRALRASLHAMLLAAEDPETGPDKYLGALAEQHSSRELKVGSELYDLWLDSLLATVRKCDPECDSGVEEAWEKVMMVGISYLLRRY